MANQRRTQWLSHWALLYKSLVERPLVRDACPASVADRATWAEAIVLLCILTEDLGFCTPTDSRVTRWAKRIWSIDVVRVSSIFKDVDAFLVSLYEDASSISWTDFKHQLDEKYGSVDNVIGVISGRLSRFACFCEVQEFRKLHQWLRFTNHINFRDIPDDDVVEEFVNWDASLHQPDMAIAIAIRDILHDWFVGFEITFRPQHGPGSTADAGRGSTERKYTCLGTDQMLKYAFGNSPYDLSDFIPYRGNQKLDRCSKLVCVPKTILTKRTICMEPATLQYFQQMVKNDIYDFIEKSPTLSQHIRLTDQSVNRNAARDGSYFGSLCTIDLSKASDSVTWDLARIAFSRTPLLRWFYATRSSQVELPSGERIDVKKFAPMGSALCFPIETLIFTSVCEYATRVTGIRNSYYVYGDDIVCDSRIFDFVVDALTRLGFSVNNSKSFSARHANCFRESCGGHYVGGLDVTPLLLSRWFVGGSVDTKHPDSIQGLVTLCNECNERGFLGCRTWIISKFNILPKHLRPPFSTSGWGIVPRSSSFYGRDVRYNRNLCRLEMRAGCITPVDKQPLGTEWLRLFHWFLLKRRSDEPVRSTAIGKVQGTKISSRWVPVTYD